MIFSSSSSFSRYALLFEPLLEISFQCFCELRHVVSLTADSDCWVGQCCDVSVGCLERSDDWLAAPVSIGKVGRDEGEGKSEEDKDEPDEPVTLTGDSQVGEAMEGTGGGVVGEGARQGGGGSTSGGESSRAEKVIAYLKLSFCLNSFVINLLTYHVL